MLKTLATVYLLCVAVFYWVYTLLAIHAYGWRALVADEWRTAKYYLDLAFPENVLLLDNGHRPVFPALVELAQTHWLNQIEQLYLGAALAAMTVALIAALVWRDSTLSAFRRACCVALSSLAILWLANWRILMHGNASIRVYLAATFLVAALWQAQLSVESTRTTRPGAWSHLTAATLAAGIATFCLGAGLGAFVAVLSVLIVQHATRAQLCLVLAGMLGALVGYMLLPGGTEVRSSIQVAPLDNIEVAARWLAGPAVHLIRPYHRIATRLFNPHGGGSMMSWDPGWPMAILGFVGVLLLFGLTFTLWQSGHVLKRTQALGLGLAWFALAAAGIVAAGRLRYFEIYPGEIYAERYQPGPSLLWLGLGLLVLGTVRARRWRLVRAAQVAALCLPILALPTEVLMTRRAKVAHYRVNLFALGLIAGALAASRTHAETLPAEVLSALPGVRERGLSMFSWPVAELVGQRLTTGAGRRPLVFCRMTITPVENLLPGAASAVRLDVDGAGAPPLLLFLDHHRRVIGLAIRDVEGPARTYAGWVQGAPRTEDVTVVPGSDQAVPFQLYWSNPLLEIPKRLATALGVPVSELLE